MIGERLKHAFEGNDAWVLSYREECFTQIGLKPSLKTPLYNGSLECELRKYQLFSGKYNEVRAEGVEVKSEDDKRQMAQKRRFKQNRDFKKGLDEKDDRRSFEQRRRDAEDERRRDMEEHGGRFRRFRETDDEGRGKGYGTRGGKFREGRENNRPSFHKGGNDKRRFSREDDRRPRREGNYKRNFRNEEGE